MVVPQRADTRSGNTDQNVLGHHRDRPSLVAGVMVEVRGLMTTRAGRLRNNLPMRFTGDIFLRRPGGSDRFVAFPIMPKSSTGWIVHSQFITFFSEAEVTSPSSLWW